MLMRSECTTPNLRKPGLTLARVGDQPHRQMEENRIRETVLPSLYPNKGECEISR
jgi:hypothetical protein